MTPQTDLYLQSHKCFLAAYLFAGLLFSSCMARRKALMTSGRQGCVLKSAGLSETLFPQAEPPPPTETPPSVCTHLAGLRSAWLAGPEHTLLYSQRSPGRSLAAQPSRRAPASPALAAATQTDIVKSIMTKPLTNHSQGSTICNADACSLAMALTLTLTLTLPP